VEYGGKGGFNPDGFDCVRSGPATFTHRSRFSTRTPSNQTMCFAFWEEIPFRIGFRTMRCPCTLHCPPKILQRPIRQPPKTHLHLPGALQRLLLHLLCLVFPSSDDDDDTTPVALV
jgi:hypothetical protein